MLELVVFQVWTESRVTQAQLEVLVFQVWMAVMEPEETEVFLEVQDDRDLMENWVCRD